MLKTILSISGKPGLYKLISQGKNTLIVEAITADKKRLPIHAREKTISLGDIAMYTNDGEVPLREVMTSIKEKENGVAVALDVKKATNDELRAYMGEVLADYDRERVHINDIKKLISWYNLLVNAGMADFKEPEQAEEAAE